MLDWPAPDGSPYATTRCGRYRIVEQDGAVFAWGPPGSQPLDAIERHTLDVFARLTGSRPLRLSGLERRGRELLCCVSSREEARAECERDANDA